MSDHRSNVAVCRDKDSTQRAFGDFRAGDIKPDTLVRLTPKCDPWKPV